MSNIKFMRDQSCHSFPVSPICMKMKDKRWKVERNEEGERIYKCIHLFIPEKKMKESIN